MSDDSMVISRARYQSLKKQNKQLKELVADIQFIAGGRHNTYRNEHGFQLQGIRELIKEYKDNE